MSPRLVLVGLPGSGKTTVGRVLAQRLGVAFIDTDDLVVEATGRQVSQVFAEQGEAAFRSAETDAVARALEGDAVVSLGGGAVLSRHNRQALLDSGVPVVLLHASMTVLAGRVGDGSGRPLLSGSPVTRLAELASARDGYYRAVARFAVDTDARVPEQVADAVIQVLASRIETRDALR